MALVISCAALQRESRTQIPAITKLQPRLKCKSVGWPRLAEFASTPMKGTTCRSTSRRKTFIQTKDRAAALNPGKRRRQTTTQAARAAPSQMAENRLLTAEAANDDAKGKIASI
jgi:hypothetical protein